MNAQQLHDIIIVPTMYFMRRGFNSKSARYLMLCTSAIESDCGEYLAQNNGGAMGPWQVEPKTYFDILENCDALVGNHEILS